MKYIKNDFLEWMYGQEDMETGDYDDVFSANEIWKHAQKLLKTEDSPLYRADTITNLKKAVNFRLKSIERIYKIGSIPTTTSSKRTLEKFEELGLVRPNILKDLVEIRNLIEHENADPPSRDECCFYIDIVWYFLKSTDNLVDEILVSFVYDSEDGKSKVCIKVKLDDPWSFWVSGYLHQDYFTDKKSSSSIEVKQEPSFGEGGYANFSSELIVNDYYRKRLATEYFGLRGFWHEDRA